MMHQEFILDELLKQLWNSYTRRVHYTQVYTQMMRDSGGRVVNDHIALRSLNTKTGSQPAGIAGLERVFLPLGYEKKTRYDFPSKHLTAYHYEHPDPLKPKIFISQLEVAELPEHVQAMINEVVKDTPDTLPQDFIMVDELVNYFSRPWMPPKRSLIEAVNEVSQYAAWTLLHGNSVNHFTAFINEQQSKDYPDLATTVEALAARGVPMKDEMEGEAGSKLRQSSTHAVIEPVQVMTEDGLPDQMEWSYAYYELAERGNIIENGEEKQFSGFLGEQATNLFEMTKKN